MQVKSFGHLVKGLRLGVDLLTILHEEGRQIPSLSKILNCPAMAELDQFLSVFEAAIETSFPHYQVPPPSLIMGVWFLYLCCRISQFFSSSSSRTTP